MEEINIILKEKDLTKYFIEVFGSPIDKTSNVKYILNKYPINKDDVVFIGDAKADKIAAENNLIKFIGRYTVEEDIKKERFIIKDLLELEEILKRFMSKLLNLINRFLSLFKIKIIRNYDIKINLAFKKKSHTVNYEIDFSFHDLYNKAQIKTDMLVSDNALRRNRHFTLIQLLIIQ